MTHSYIRPQPSKFKYIHSHYHLVFESLVQSQSFAYFWQDRDWDWSINIPDPPKTGLDRFRPVFFGLDRSFSIFGMVKLLKIYLGFKSSPYMSKMSQNWWRYQDINKVLSSYRTFDKMLNISVSFQPIDMLLGYIWRGNWGAQKTSLFAVFYFKISKNRTAGPVFSSLGLVFFWSFPVLRLDFQTLLLPWLFLTVSCYSLLSLHY